MNWDITIIVSLDHRVSRHTHTHTHTHSLSHFIFLAMVLIPFIPLSQNEFETLIKNQNRLLVAGQGHSDINIFCRYRPTRRGQGVLSFLSKYGRYALPFIKKFIIPSAKDFSKNVASDMIGGSSLKSSLKNRGKQSLKDIGKRILSGAGSGVRRKRKYKLKSLRKLK